MNPLKSLKGIGPASLKYLKEAGITSVEELLEYYPREYEFRDETVTLSEVYKSPGSPVTVNTICEVTGYSFFGFGNNKTLKVFISDSSADACLVCFGRNFLQQSLITGKKYFIHGIFSIKYGEIQSGSFDFENFSDRPKFFNKILPVYPLTSKLTQGFLRKIIIKALEDYGKFIPDLLPGEILQERGLLHKAESIRNIHFPDNRDLLDLSLYTLKYEELFLFQQTILQIRHRQQQKKRVPRNLSRELQQKIIKKIPFALTSDQASVIDEIYRDSVSDSPMSRILQGDVGCGKTLVGFLSAVPYMEAGYQAAFMAPTELLARQHLITASKLFEKTGIRIAFLTGKLTGTKKELVVQALEKGDIDLIIGTHALLSEPVKFAKLGFAIIDEQQKFGVAQRNALYNKSEELDYLMMSATPIPQTLQLSVLGDLSVSTIKTMPAGRLPVKTHTVFEQNIAKVYSWVRSELQKGFQAYFIYPLIEESQKLNLKNAEAMFKHLQNNIFPDYRCSLIHSRIPEEDKEVIMKEFADGKISILTATSVIEVGIDVPKATCMIIEHAERFGLSSLHQLRGRIGRGAYQSYTFLVFGDNLTDEAKKRLRAIKETNDGFVIAEEDLKIRGPGDFLPGGLRQAGYIGFKLADLVQDAELIALTNKDAQNYYKT